MELKDSLSSGVLDAGGEERGRDDLFEGETGLEGHAGCHSSR